MYIPGPQSRSLSFPPSDSAPAPPPLFFPLRCAFYRGWALFSSQFVSVELPCRTLRSPILSAASSSHVAPQHAPFAVAGDCPPHHSPGSFPDIYGLGMLKPCEVVSGSATRWAVSGSITRELRKYPLSDPVLFPRSGIGRLIHFFPLGEPSGSVGDGVDPHFLCPRPTPCPETPLHHPSPRTFGPT